MLSVLWFLYSIVLSASHWCGTDELINSGRYKPQYINPRHESRRQLQSRDSSYSQIRIAFEYQNLQGFSSAQQTEFKEVADRVKLHFENILKVQRLNQPIFINCIYVTCSCNGLALPNTVTNAPGWDDIDLLMVVETTTDSNSGWIAASGGCFFDTSHRRIPVMGSLQINTAFWDHNADYEEKHHILMHEVTHTLAFIVDASYTDNWTDSSGNAHSTITESVSWRGMTSTVLATPEVKSRGRTLYGCSNLTGVGLEMQGGLGTAGSHWEKRIAKEEYMVGDVAIDEPSYSVLTFALFEDTGWYEVNWEWTMPMNWGAGEGCSFHEDACINNSEQSAFPEYFCTDSTEKSVCDFNNLHVGYWGFARYSAEIPTEYQYFSDPYTGGLDANVDYCPYINSYSNKNCRGTGGNTFISDVIGETIGFNSRCIEMQIVPTGYSSSVDDAFCLEVLSCTDSAVTFKFAATSYAAETTVVCGFGASTTVNGYDGTFNCPPTNDYCKDVPCPFACQGAGTCVNSACVCIDGYGGTSCEYLCDLTCKSCSGTGSSDCTECYSGTTLSGSTCSVECNTGFEIVAGQCSCRDGRYVTASDTCESCSGNCWTCSGSSTTCTSCSADKQLLDGTCVCASNYYESITGLCDLCDATCTECTAQRPCVCGEPNISIDSGSRCGCPSGATNDNGTCACPGNPLWGCNDGEVETDSGCIVCDVACDGCDAAGNQGCFECASGYRFNQIWQCVLITGDDEEDYDKDESQERPEDNNYVDYEEKEEEDDEESSGSSDSSSSDDSIQCEFACIVSLVSIGVSLVVISFLIGFIRLKLLANRRLHAATVSNDSSVMHVTGSSPSHAQSDPRQFSGDAMNAPVQATIVEGLQMTDLTNSQRVALGQQNYPQGPYAHAQVAIPIAGNSSYRPYAGPLSEMRVQNVQETPRTQRKVTDESEGYTATGNSPTKKDDKNKRV